MSFESNFKHSTSRRILVIDNDPDNLEILLQPFRWEAYDARSATSEREAHKILDHWVPQVVILDWLTPTMEGLRILKSLRERLPNVSCVFVSDNSSTEAIIEALDAGADDYIVKPFVPLELLARVRTQLRIRDLHEQLLFANEKLKELADTDDLSGLYNMRSLYQKLEFEMERGRRFDRDVCVVMMDMDYFKTVNDGHDHLFGSYVLSEVGKIIRANTRNIDIPARYGGDEFLVVLTETDHAGALHFCNRLRAHIEKTTFRNGTDTIQLTASLGFAITIMGENIDARELVRRADHALYDSKRNGRNQVSFYRSDQAPVVELHSQRKKRKAAG